MSDTGAPPDHDKVMAALAQLQRQLAAAAGPVGEALRKPLAQLAATLAATDGGDGSDDQRRAQAADQLEQLITAITGLGRQLAGALGARPDLDLGKLAGGLRGFVDYLRAPSEAGKAALEQRFGILPEVSDAGASEPGDTREAAEIIRGVPLDQLKVDGTIEQLAGESARRQGLTGDDARQAVERMKRQMAVLIKDLEARARLEASRARTAAEFDRLVERVVATGSELGKAVDDARGQLSQAFRRVDLARMAAGLQAFAAWLASAAAAGDAPAHVAELKAKLAAVLGPATTGDPARSEDERRADFQRDIQAAVDKIFRKPS